MSIAIGIGGAVVGGFLGRSFGFYGQGQPAGFLISVLVPCCSWWATTRYWGVARRT